jgi:putative transposase
MVGRRHGTEEIADKLAQADELVSQGKNQQEISRVLGISIMTYHRWRKLRHTTDASQDHGEDWRATSTSEAAEDAGHVHGGERTRGGDRLRDLEIENTRLRRLVTDLLLEKVSLEDRLRERQDLRYGHGRRS